MIFPHNFQVKPRPISKKSTTYSEISATVELNFWEVVMFFNQHVKQGREVGAEGLKLLKNCFEGTRYVQGDDFNPPHDLFDDLYIRGYFTSYFGYIKDFAYGGEAWSSQRKGHTSLLVASGCTQPQWLHC